VQNGQGPTSVDDFILVFGGDLQGTVEAQRGSVNAVIVIDGGSVEGLETQNANMTFSTPVNPTYYLRSGEVGSEPDETWGNQGDEHFVIDPINSQDAAFWQDFANDPTSDFSTANINTLLGSGPGSAPANPDLEHLLIIEAEGNVDFPEGRIALGNGNDTLDFVGAINMGDGIHNLQFGDEPGENEVPLIDGDGGDTGTPGTNDILTVAGGSQLLLGDIVNFESWNIRGGSVLALEGEEYEVGDDVTPGQVFVEGGSVLWLQAEEVEFEVEHFELGGPIGNALFKPSDQYNAFDPGGMIFIGGAEEEEEEVEDDIVLTLAEDDDDEEEEEEPGEEEEEEEEELEPVEVTFEVGGGPEADTFVNGGTINTINRATGDVFGIVGDYQSNNGNLAIDTALGTPESDRLVVDGAVDGTTTIYVNNTAERANQEARRVVVAEALQGGLTDDSFQLGQNAITGRREVLDGAFAYRLGINDTEAFLFGDLLDQVPGYATAPSVANHHVIAEFGTLYQRMGELRRASPAGSPNPLRPSTWVRGKDAAGASDRHQL
jgi:hypothetical protein